MKTPSIAFAFLLLVACGDDDGRDIDASTSDSGSTPDSALPDSGARNDTGTDSGPSDSGPADASMDAGARGALCPATEMCNVVLGSGCEAEQGCYVAGGDGEAMSVCAPAGTAAMGAECTTADGCLPGLSCIGNICQPLCCGGSDADCPTGGVCRGLSDLDGIGVCLLPDGCDLVAQSGCDATEGCYPLSPEGGTRCGDAGAAAPGAACEASNDCASGSICLDDSVCHSLCEIGSATCGDQSCVNLNGFEDVGVCIDPA